MNCPPEVFATARLSARKPRVDDAPAIFASYANDPEVTRYLSWPAYQRVEPLKTFLSEAISHWEKCESPFTWVLCLKGSDRPIGSIGVTLERGKAMFGYVLAKKFWGRGLVAEALTFLVEWSLTQPEIGRAWAYCDVENPASVRVMEKAGMVREGLLHRWHACPTLGPELRDCFVCAKVK
jgi:[ribosomal protein S5]-alanine N-acetyltransferase